MKIALLALSLISTHYLATAQTPILVEDVNMSVTAGDFNPYGFSIYKNKLYFKGNEGTTGTELFMYDATDIIMQVQDLNPYSTFGMYDQMLDFGGKLTMSGRLGTRKTLLQYDGSNPIVEAPGMSSFAALGDLSNLTLAGGKLYYSAGVAGFNAAQLFSYNGSSAPVRVNIPQAPNGTQPSHLEEFGGKLFYSGYDTASKLSKLFMLDPALNTPVLFTTTSFPGGFTSPTDMYSAGGSMYFVGFGDTASTEIFRYDGTNITRLTNTPLTNNNRPMGPLTMYKGSLYYHIGGGSTGVQLYKCNPVSGSSSLAYNGASPIYKEYNGKLYMAINTPAHGQELWVHNGTNTTMVADLYPGTNGGVKDIIDMIVYKGNLFFTGNNGTTGRELFQLTTPNGISAVSAATNVTVFPNPVSDYATMEFMLKEGKRVAMAVCDATGRQVSATVPAQYPAGLTRLNIPMHSLSAGQYFYRLTTAEGQLLAAGCITRQ